jgi:hypothetical protein
LGEPEVQEFDEESELMMKMWRAFARKEDDEDIFGGAASEIINVNDLEYSNKSA